MLAPHLGSATRETRTAMAELAVANVLAVLDGTAAADAGMKLPPQPAVPRGRIAGGRCAGSARAIDGLEEPAVEKIAEDQQDDPFQVLIATMLSAQTKDAVTHAASTRLFRVARTPRTMASCRSRD